MKTNKLIPIVVSIIAIPVLSGCYQKIDRKTYLEVFNDEFTPEHTEYYLENQFGFATEWLTDFDKTVANELMKLDAQKKYTKPEVVNKLFTYSMFRRGSDGYSRQSIIKYYDNGSVVINDFGTYTNDSYSYFTISKEEANELFKFVNDRFEYADQVEQEDIKATKDEKGIDQLVDALKQKQSIKGSLKGEEFTDNGQLINTLENIEYTHTETNKQYNVTNRELCLTYNTPYSYGIDNDYPWFLALSRDYLYVYVVNYMERDRVGRTCVSYYNTYHVEKEAGLAIYQEAVKIASK